MKLIILYFIFFNTLNASDFYYYENNKKILLKNINMKLKSNVNENLDYYQNYKGIVLAVNNRLY